MATMEFNKRPRDEDAWQEDEDINEVEKRQRRHVSAEGSAGNLGSGGDDESLFLSNHDPDTTTSSHTCNNGQDSSLPLDGPEDDEDDITDGSQGVQSVVPAATGSSSASTASPSEGTLIAQEGPLLICYGMVPRIKCKRLNNQAESVIEPEASENENEATYLPLDLTVKQGRLVVGTLSCPDLVYMNTKATAALLEAFKYGVEVKLLTKREVLHSFLHSNERDKPAEFLEIDANVLGPESAREDVGRLLSRHSVYLQDPHSSDDRIKYSNPHVMELDVSAVDIWFQELEMDLMSGRTKATENNDWNIVLDDLPQQHNFNATRIEVDRAIVKTLTMQHQGEALDFMCKREVGGVLMDSDLRFWQLDRNEDGAPVYRHTVTADEIHESQPEPQGGILADDMGLGKTLTSISLIACSLDRAYHFAEDLPNHIARDPEALPRSRATLVIVPSTQLMDSWIKELDKHTCPDTLKISKYHGHDRVRHYSELLDNDIVLTTYGTIATEFRRTRRKVLYHMRFFRIVLDEAHTIRSRRTKLFRAVTTLDAAHHWCLTGTPISNKVDDLGALLDFCRVPLLGDSKCFQQHVGAVARKSQRRVYGVLMDVLKPLCLRRNRALLKIAQPKAIEKVIEFSTAEQRQYQAIMKRSRQAIDDAVAGRTGTNSRNIMLKVLLELRIFCNRGTFTPEDKDDNGDDLDADEQLTLLEEKEEAFCGVCLSAIAMVNQLEDPSSGVLGDCSDVLCRLCYDDAIDDDTQQSGYTCPVCNQHTELEQLQRSTGVDEGSHTSSQHSSKLNALTEDLLSSQNSPSPEKSIVFSVWRKTLDIAETLCEERNIRCIRIDGTTSQSERLDRLHDFTHDPSISTLLMTMGTGALGLNITAASRIHILEPQWNPAVEDQAVGRAVRLGQAKNATVIRYIVKDSVEKQIQGYQKRKMRLAAGGFEGRNEGPTQEETVQLNAAYLHRTEEESGGGQ